MPTFKSLIVKVFQQEEFNPSSIELNNDFGDVIEWTRNAVGDYRGTLAGAFPESGFWVSPGNGNGTAMIPLGTNSIADYYYYVQRMNDDSIGLFFVDTNYQPVEMSVAVPSAYLYLPEIRIYP